MDVIEGEAHVEKAVEVRAVGNDFGKVGTQPGHAKTFTIEDHTGAFLAGKSEEHAANRAGAQRGDEPRHVAAIFAQREDFHTETEFARAALNAFVFPAANVLLS